MNKKDYAKLDKMNREHFELRYEMIRSSGDERKRLIKEMDDLSMKIKEYEDKLWNKDLPKPRHNFQNKRKNDLIKKRSDEFEYNDEEIIRTVYWNEVTGQIYVDIKGKDKNEMKLRGYVECTDEEALANKKRWVESMKG